MMLISLFLKDFILNSIERAKQAINVKSHADLARFLVVTPSAIPGYERRGALPLEQCIKVAEQTGVSLDWLIMGKGEMHGAVSPELNPEQKMLLTGFDALTSEQQDCVFNIIRRLTRGEDIVCSKPALHISGGNIAQANAGNGHIEHVSVGK
nr:MAG TPA: CI repressor [Caudoviricetes sp.]